DYIEDALSASDKTALDLHFQTCAACAELLADVNRFLDSRVVFPVHATPEWLAPRIIANTPQVVRETLADTVRGAWQWVTDPRTAMAVFTATMVLAWLGGQAGVTPQSIADLRNPTAVYEEASGLLSGAYNAAVRAYYRSPLV